MKRLRRLFGPFLLAIMVMASGSAASDVVIHAEEPAQPQAAPEQTVPVTKQAIPQIINEQPTENQTKASGHFQELTWIVQEDLSAASVVLEIARINTELAQTKLTPKEQVFARERLGVLQWALPLRCKEESDLSRKDRADIKVRFAWIGEALKQGHSTLAMPDTSRYVMTSSVQYLVFQITCKGTTKVNPHLARALHTALGHTQLSNGEVGLEIEVPMKPGTGWLGYIFRGEPVY